MVQALERSLTFDEFLESYPDDENLYELINGAVVPVKPTGPHGRVSAFVLRKARSRSAERRPTFLHPQTCYVKPQSDKAGLLARFGGARRAHDLTKTLAGRKNQPSLKAPPPNSSSRSPAAIGVTTMSASCQITKKWASLNTGLSIISRSVPVAISVLRSSR
jgi:hypothetical protein